MAKETFSTEQVVTALASMGYTSFNAETSADFLADAGKCRLLVGKVQGEEAIKRTDPVYQERYRSRAKKMLQDATSALSSTSKTAPAVTSTETSNPALPETTKTADAVKAPVQQQEKKVMAKAAKVAKSKGKKAAKKAAAPKKDKAPGVIDRIVETLRAGKNTAAALAEKVAKRFPDREAEGIAATVKIQLSRLEKPKGEGGRGLKIKRDKQEGTNELLYSI